MAQEYLPEAEQGEKRLLLLNAEPIRVGDRVAIYRRRAVHAPERRRARRGPVRGKCDFGAVEARICDILRPKLLADGLYFVGVDIVGDSILELNVFTPGGIHAVHELYGVDVADIVIARPRASRPPAGRLPHDVRSRSRGRGLVVPRRRV